MQTNSTSGGWMQDMLRASIKCGKDIPQISIFSFEPYAVGYTMDWTLFREL
jgi:hypothetical protein